MSKGIYLGGINATTSCNKKRANYGGVNITSEEKEQFKRTKITRKAVLKYKYENLTMEEVDTYIDEEFNELSFPSLKIMEENKKEVKDIVNRYLDADPRRSIKPDIKEFKFDGNEYSYKPTFIYEDTAKIRKPNKKGEMEVPVIELVTLTTGKAKFTNGNGLGAITSSLHHCPEGFGAVMYGKMMLDGKTGIVRVSADSMKTANDKKGDYTNPFEICPTDKKGNKSGFNRNYIEVAFKDGKIIPIDKGIKYSRIYKDYTMNSKLEYDTTTIFANYKKALESFQKGKEKCSEAECKKSCEFYALCHYNHQPVALDEEKIEGKAALPALNEAQQSVCNFREGIGIACACAGSGKTQSETLRVAQLLKEGVQPEKILVLSFSKAAVAVFRQRIKSFVEDVYGLDVDTSKITIQTFNGLGYEIIKSNYEVLGYTDIPTMVDDIETLRIIRNIICSGVIPEPDETNAATPFDFKNYMMKPMNRSQQGGICRLLSKEISIIRDNGMTDDEYRARIESKAFSKEQIDYILQVKDEYSKILRMNNLLDYSDQSYQVSRLMDIDEDLITESDEYSFEHILVDEAQDTSPFQAMLIRLMCNSIEFKSLLVVGDDDQSIYSFRGCNADMMLNFEKNLSMTGFNTSDFCLGINYRSSQEIVDLTGELIEKNKVRINKALSSGRGYLGNKPVFKGFDKPDEEVAYICDRIEELIANGVAKKDIACLSATRGKINAISRELSKRGILSQFDMGERLLANSRVQAAIAISEFIFDPSVTKGLLIYLNEMYNNKLFDTFSNEQINNMIVNATKEFVTIYGATTMDEKKTYVLNVLKALDDGTDAIYTSFLDRITSKQNYNVFEILNYIRDFNEMDSDATAEKSGKYDSISLSTAHSSKGKEWKHVFVSASDFDTVSSRSSEQVEEKRRLLYVAMTRAQDELYVTTTRTKNNDSESDVVLVNPWYVELKKLKNFDNQDKPLMASA